MVTPLVGEFIQSYKDLDACSVYQIQWKFRNEKRAKSGLLRGREFLMKDMYSFHRTQEELDTYFEVAHAAYDRVFARLGLADSTHYTFASGGDFSKYSYEFQTELGIGEDEIFYIPSTGESFNLEIAPSEIGTKNISELLKVREDVFLEGVTGVSNLLKALNIDITKSTKTMIYKLDDKDFVFVVLRSDYSINELKLSSILNTKNFCLATDEEVKSLT